MSTTHRVFLCSASASNVASTDTVVATHLTATRLEDFLRECRQHAAVYSPEVSYTVKENYMQGFVVYWKGLPSLDDALITAWKRLWVSRFPGFDECKICSSYLSGIQMSCPRVRLRERRLVDDDACSTAGDADADGGESDTRGPDTAGWRSAAGTTIEWGLFIILSNVLYSGYVVYGDYANSLVQRFR